ncbi:MAG: hypothetical protein ABGZ24_18210, partial [Fuerstiella sp.]
MKPSVLIIPLMFFFTAPETICVAGPDEAVAATNSTVAAATDETPQDEKPAPPNPFPDAVAV